MLLNDSISDGQPQAGAASSNVAVFCREKRVVYPLDVFLGYAGARVGNHDLYPVAIGGADRKGAALRHSIFRVEEQVQEDLLQLTRVAIDEGQAGTETLFHTDVRGLHLMLEKRQSLVDDLVEVNVLELGSAGAREIQQAVDDLRSTEGLVRDLLQQGRALLITLKLLGEHLRVRRDNRQRRIDFMSDAGREQSDG